MKAPALMKFRRLVKSRAASETFAFRRSIHEPASFRADEELVELEELGANLKARRSKKLAREPAPLQGSASAASSEPVFYEVSYKVPAPSTLYD